MKAALIQVWVVETQGVQPGGSSSSNYMMGFLFLAPGVNLQASFQHLMPATQEIHLKCETHNRTQPSYVGID